MMGNRWVLGLRLFFLSVFLVATTYTCLASQNSTVGCHERERLALLKFRHSVKDKFKMLSSWVGVDCCSWKGVRCDGATRSVSGLRLRGNYIETFSYDPLYENYYLIGDNVNTYLAELRHLKHLDLSGNNFQGSRIPKFIGSFKQLSYLNLSNAHFNGIIPHHIGNLSNLKVLDLGSSFMLTPNDMAWVSGLSSLEHLDLSDVYLSPAKNIDMVLYMIPKLTYLSLSNCGLSNADIGLQVNSSKIHPNIKHLDLSSNFFEGQLPLFFQNMTSLTFLDLSYYNLSLAWNSLNLLYMLPTLSELHLRGCGLHTLPFSPDDFNSSAQFNIWYLDLSGNLIQGRFPGQFKNMTSLRVLDLSQNSLNSIIPVMPNLQRLDVSYNKFEQIELVGVWRQCYLKELSISGNDFGEEMIGPSTNMSECSQYALEMLESYENQLIGSIPKSIGRLTNLRVLDLDSNQLTGSIPKSLERLRSLEVLYLAYNNFTGLIPTFLGKLTKLDLSRNQFSGSIPELLGRLTCLTELFLDLNQLTGPVPTSLGRLASLQTLLVSYNSLEGVVLEAHFANLSMLKRLDTTSNYKLIFNISHKWIPPFQLISVQLGSCKIAHGFPQWLQTQKTLRELVLSNASLYGFLPTWLQKMTYIYHLDLSHNKLSGSLINLPFSEDTKYLLLKDNQFNGSIPRSLCRRTHLIVFDVSMNRLSGNMPECLEDLQHIEVLILSSNELSGVLPSSLGNISSGLKWLKLNDNIFNGELPRDLGNLEILSVLDIGDNEFSGNIPSWIGKNLTYLVVLRLHKNNFTGNIPQSLCQCSNLHILDVAHNNLTGSIPPCFGELSGMIREGQKDFPNSIYSVTNVIDQVMKGIQLEYTKNLGLVINMDLSSNNLIGQIPIEVTTLTSLVGLNLSHNYLNGSIPDSIGNMKALFSLDFSDNQFTGMIPPSMEALNFLSSLNLSHNNLSGQIPRGNQLQTLTDPSIYAGNRGLCAAPLPNSCSNPGKPSATSKNKYKDVDQPKNLWFYVDIMCGFTTGFWGIIGVLFFKKQWRQKLFMTAEVTMDNVYVAVAVRVSKIKRGREVN